MLSFSGSLKIWVALEPCDMRKGYDGLAALVEQRFGLEARSGALFVFANKSRTRLKILYWDGSGLWVMGKTNIPHCPSRQSGASVVSISSVIWK